MTNAPTTRSGLPAWVRPAVPVFVMVALMWITEIIDLIIPLDLDMFGIRPRDTTHFEGILLAPFLHLGFEHLMSNTTALLVLGVLLALTTRHMWIVTIGVILGSGLGVWLFGGANTLHIGASGVVYGFAAFLAVYGFVARQLAQVIVGVVVMVAYGSMLWGVLPIYAGVSWEGHLFGAVAGVLLAVWLGRKDRHQPLRPAAGRGRWGPHR